MEIKVAKIYSIRGDEPNIYRVQFHDRDPKNNGWSVQVGIAGSRKREFFKDCNFNDDPEKSFKAAVIVRDSMLNKQHEWKSSKTATNEHSLHYSGNKMCRYVRMRRKVKPKFTWHDDKVTCSTCLKVIRDLKLSGELVK